MSIYGTFQQSQTSKAESPTKASSAVPETGQGTQGSAPKQPSLLGKAVDFVKGIFGAKTETPAPEPVKPETPVTTPEPKSIYETFKNTQAPKDLPVQDKGTSSIYDQFKNKDQSSGNKQNIESPYFYAKTPGGGTIGQSDQKDTSGKPYLAYRNPGDTATTTDKTRVATHFDPRTPQVLTPDSFLNKRAVDGRAALKQSMGGTYSDELDHKIALELSGSNDKENLQIEPLVPGTKNTATDALENSLAKDVAGGKKSLFQAQTELAKAKGMKVPWTPAEPKKGATFKDLFPNGPSDITGAQDLINKAITPPEPKDISKNPIIATLQELPSSVAENLPLGIGEIVKQLRDDPETALNLSWSDVAKSLPDAGKEAVKGFVVNPILTVAGTVLGAIKNDSNVSKITLNIPGLGEVTNMQTDAARQIADGAPLWQTILSAVPNAIFNGLFIAGLAEKGFGPRESVVSKGQATEGSVETTAPAKNFRQYTPPVSTKPIPTDVLQDLARQQGFDLGKNYDPKLPTYFRITGSADGKVTGEIVQIKPSYFQTFMNMFKGDASAVPDTQIVPLYSRNIALKDIANSASEYYKSIPNKQGGFVKIGSNAEQLPKDENGKNSLSKTQSSLPTIRDLKPEEQHSADKVNAIITGKSDQEIIAKTPSFVSNDGKERSLVLDKAIVNKVQKDHGPLNISNLIVNAHDWDYVIKNVDGNPDKINLIKKVPDSESYLTLAANRDNGFFTVTHYETETRNSDKLKNLLKNRGDSLDRTGRAAVPPFATSPKGVASQLDLPGVSNENNKSLAKTNENVKPEISGGGESSLAKQAKKQGLPLNTNIKQAHEIVKKLFNPKEIDVLFPDKEIPGVKDAWGQYSPARAMKNPLIQVVSDKGMISGRALYHESFHAYLDRFVSPTDKKALLNALKKNLVTGPARAAYAVNGYKGSDVRAEEYAADAFADYVAGKDVPPEAKSFFKRLLDKIREWIRKMTGLQKTFDEMLAKTRNYVRKDYKTMDVTHFKKGKGLTPEEGKMTEDEEVAMEMNVINQNHALELDQLTERASELAIQKETLENNPAKGLAKYVSKTGEFQGRLREVTGGKEAKSIFAKRGDDIAGELGFKDSEQAREAWEKYKEQKDKYEKQVREFKSDKAVLYKKFMDDAQKYNTRTSHPAGRYDMEVTEANRGVVPPIVRGNIQAPEMDMTKFRDLGAARLGRDTMERNLEKATGPYADELKDFLIEPVRTNEVDRTKYANDLRREIRTKVKEFKIKRNSKDDELIQKYGEGYLSLEQLQKSTKNWNNVAKAADYFRKLYDELLNKANEERGKYWYSAIPKRQEYFRHFNDINEWTKDFGVLRNNNQLPTEIAGMTHAFRPGKPFSTAELHRIGNHTSYSALGGMDNYLDSMTRQMFHIDSIQRGRALEKYIRKVARENPGLKLPNLVQNIQEWSNLVSGKAAMLDRSIESTIGRPIMRFMKTVANRIGKNIVAGNLSVAMTHLVSIPLNLATVDKVPFTRALMHTLVSPLKNEPITHIDGQESSFLTRRYPEKYILPTKFQKIEETISWLFHITDVFKSKLAVSSKYYEGLNKGFSKSEAMAEADKYAGRIVGDYSTGNRPNLMNTHTTALVAQFQLGVNDGLSVLLHDIPHWEKGNKWKIGSRLVAFAVFSYLFNLMYKKMRGSGKGLDPIDAGLTATGLNEEGAGQDFLTRLKLAGSDVLGELPFTSIAFGTFPLASTVSGPLKNTLFGPDRTGGATQLAADLVSPFGGGTQAKKTYEGIKAFQAGETRTGTGQLKQPIEQTPTNLIKGAVFGKSAFSDVRSTNLETQRLQGILGQSKGSITRQAEDLFSSMKAMPKDQAAKAFDDLTTSNPSMAKRIESIAKEDKLGLTQNDRLIKQLNVSLGVRAKYIYDKLQSLTDSKAKAALWDDYVAKHIITPQVETQLIKLLGK